LQGVSGMCRVRYADHGKLRAETHIDEGVTGMIKELGITVLSENRAGARGLLAEHGWALWVEADGRKILFDTGQGMVLTHNGRKLDVDLSITDDVVLSHGHYDHTGGLDAVLAEACRPDVYVHPAAFQAKYGKGADGVARSIGCHVRSADEVRSRSGNVVLTQLPTEIVDGVWVTGEIPRRSDFEDTGGPFFLDEKLTKPDPLVDDQAMYIESRKGTIVLLGCAHAGLVNTLDRIAELTSRDEIHAVLGGMHLHAASEERIERSVEALERHSVRVLGPAHCTGRQATSRLWARFPDRCVECPTGSRFAF